MEFIRTFFFLFFFFVGYTGDNSVQFNHHQDLRSVTFCR